MEDAIHELSEHVSNVKDQLIDKIEFEEFIENALKAYKNREYYDAILHLRFAIDDCFHEMCDNKCRQLRYDRE